MLGGLVLWPIGMVNLWHDCVLLNYQGAVDSLSVDPISQINSGHFFVIGHGPSCEVWPYFYLQYYYWGVLLFHFYIC